MINRLLKQRLLLLLTISLFVLPRVSAQNSTFIPEPGGNVCPVSRFFAPIMVDSIANVDSLLLVLHYSSNTLTYVSERQRHPLLRDNGVFAVTSPNDTTVIVKWVANTPQTIIDDKIIELEFLTGNQAGTINFDENESYFRNAQGNITTNFDGASLNFFEPLSVVLEEIDATCPNSCDANVAAYVTGGTRPYQFLWQGESSVFDSVYAGACGGINNLLVTDANQCVLDTNFTVSELTASEVEMVTDPDTVYMQNPVINFSFTGDPGIVDWLWEFGDGTIASREQAPIHVYSSAANPDIENYTAVLQIVNESGCVDTVSLVIPISEAELFIPNVFTPNDGDQINNYFKIAKNQNERKIPIDSEFIRMELVVLDRWGRKVYDNGNYKNDWDGDNLPEGTYYYRLNTFGYFKDESYKGAVTILR